MLSKLHHIGVLPANILDSYLAAGWFRMQQMLFTTHFINFKNKFYNAVWLRVNVADYVPDSTHIKLIKRNRQFRVATSPLQITHELEDLLLLYKQSIGFETYHSIAEALLDEGLEDRFNTQQILLYDENRLIAAGFFDIGQEAAEGILCIYHPNYKKYTTGNYLKYLMLDYCKQHQIHYFYPGYFVPGYAPFDYKLSIAKQSLEFYEVVGKQWLSIAQYQSSEHDLLRQINEKLSVLKDYLVNKGVGTKLLHYRRFDVALAGFPVEQALGVPIFLYCGKIAQISQYIPIVIFNLYTQKYLLVQCTKLKQQTAAPIILLTNKLLYTTANAKDMVHTLLVLYRKSTYLFPAEKEAME